MAENPNSPRIAFPITLKRDMRKMQRDMYDPDHGLVAGVKHLRKRIDSVYLVALGTFASVTLGVLAIVLKVFFGL